MAAGEADLVVDQGATFQVDVVYKQENGTPFDLQNYSARMDIRYANTKDADALHQLGGGNNDQISIATPTTDGKIQINIPASETATWSPGSYFYDSEIFLASGYVDRVIFGQLTVRPEITSAV